MNSMRQNYDGTLAVDKDTSEMTSLKEGWGGGNDGDHAEDEEDMTINQSLRQMRSSSST